MPNFRIATRARMRFRHLFVLLSFLVFVVCPSVLIGKYLFARAQDQYLSTVAFTVRSEETSNPIDILGGLSALGSGSSSDTDILFEYIQSKSIVSALDEKLDLRGMFSKNYSQDPWFSFNPKGSIEDLAKYWASVVKVYYDRGTGLIEVQVRAFERKDAQRVAENIYNLSSNLINELTAISREDRISYAKSELERAYENLRTSRANVVTFRSKNKLVDPQAEVAMQVGVINALQKQLSELSVEHDLIIGSAKVSDPRLEDISRRMDVVRMRIVDERRKFASGTNQDNGYVEILGEFEGLMVDREYAEKRYLLALASYDAALSEAERQSRYLASYIFPTIAEKPEYPLRWVTLLTTILFSFLAWTIIVLTLYALKDRR